MCECVCVKVNRLLCVFSLLTYDMFCLVVVVVVVVLVQLAGQCLGRKFKLNPFAVRMLMIHRYFDITAAERDLKYEPILTFEEGWNQTLDWFKENWVPKFDPQHQVPLV